MMIRFDNSLFLRNTPYLSHFYRINNNHPNKEELYIGINQKG